MSSQQTLNQLERAYFVRKAGGADPKRPLNDLKREYFISQVGSTSPHESLENLRDKWLRKIIDDAGATPVGEDADLWTQAVIAIGETPTQFKNQNKRIFFEIAP